MLGVNKNYNKFKLYLQRKIKIHKSSSAKNFFFSENHENFMPMKLNDITVLKFHCMSIGECHIQELP